MSSEADPSTGVRTRPSPPRTSRAEKASATRAAIVAAALDVFAQNGFAAARMDEVAERAGVAKGTLYLHFESKEGLFEAILAETLVPLVKDMSGLRAEPGESKRAFAERVVVGLWRRLHAGRGADVVRLIFAEGPRLPNLAQAYFGAVVQPGLGVMGSIVRRAAERGEPASAAGRFPQLLVAPVVMGLLWGAMFERFEVLDVEAMIRQQLDLLFGEAEGAPASS